MHHRFSIGINTFVQATAASSCDVTTILGPLHKTGLLICYSQNEAELHYLLLHQT